MRFQDIKEARRTGDGISYKEKKVKGELDRVIAELSGKESQMFTVAAKYYRKIAQEEEKIKRARDALNEKMKQRFDTLFDPTDVIYTRVIETASLTVSMSKKSEKTTQTVTDVDGLFEDLLGLAPELADKIGQIREQYVKVENKVTQSRLGKPKLHDPKESVDNGESALAEGVLDSIVDSIKAYAIKLMNWISDWARGYDRKLDSIKSRAQAVGIL